MRKSLKITLISLASIIGIIGISIASFAIYLNVSPDFAVWILRNNFGGEPKIINPPNYDEIKENVEVEKDLIYPSSYAKNYYDIYLPKGTNKPLPVIFWIHGGAFVAGEKEGIENYATMLASEGYAVVGVDYEWAPEIKYPGQVRQIEECLTELNNVKEEYFLDLDNIVLVGDSAGAHIASQAALLATNKKYEEALNVTSAISKDALKGVILYCGPYDVSKMLNTGNKFIDFFASNIGWALMGEKNWKDGEMIKTTTIKKYVTKDFPSTFITDGNTGSFESQGKELVSSLSSLGVKCDSLFLDKTEFGEVAHEYQFNIGDEKAGSLCYQKTMSFLENIK